MEKHLTPAERAQLETIAQRSETSSATGSDASQRRHAALVLAWDDGHSIRDIAAQIGLSRSTVHYWIQRFQERRMELFAGAEKGPDTEGEAEEQERPDSSIAQLLNRFEVDMPHARQVARLALQLFDATIETHHLPAQQRDLLEAAALLHNVGLSADPERHHIVGRDILLENPPADLSAVERQIVACTTYLHRKPIKEKHLQAEVVTALPVEVQPAALALAALVRIADGLDYAQSQSTQLGEPRVSAQSIVFPVQGPFANVDAPRAEKKADLWARLFPVTLQFEPVDPASEPEEEDEDAPAPETMDTADRQEVETLVPVPVAEVDPALPALPKSAGVLPDDVMSEAGRKILRFHFDRMLAHEEGTRAGEDIEELHDMRVATRRMRSAFRIFEPYYKPSTIAPLIRGLKRTGGVLGSVRDLDVLIDKARGYLQTLPEGRQNELDPLLAAWSAQCVAAREAMVTYLDGRKYRRFVDAFAAFLDTPGAGARAPLDFPPEPYRVREIVPVLAHTRWAAVRAYERHLDSPRLELLHALRIDCKRLRYALEFFSEVLGGAVKKLIPEVVILQDHLGNLHDADVADQLLRSFLSGDAPSHPSGTASVQGVMVSRVIAPGVVTYMAVKQQELETLLETFPAVWTHFNRAEVRQWLGEALAVL